MSRSDDAIAFGVEPVSEIWRASRKRHAPMQIPPLAFQGTGRFDDRSESSSNTEPQFGVLYCCETPISSFIEVLAPLREPIALERDVANTVIMSVDERDESGRLMERAKNVVSTRWQDEWQMTNAKIISTAPAFDLTKSTAVQFVRERLALSLTVLGLEDLDFSNILGSDRDLTQSVSRWIWSLENKNGEPLFSGIRYRSRFDPECICLALYQNRYSIDGDVHTQPITPDTPGFAEAATILRLNIS